MNPRSILVRLQPERADARLVSAGSGWEHRVWAVDDDLVLRVNPTADLAARTAAVERDVRLLALVGNHLTVPVGEVVAAEPRVGAMLVRRIRGCSVADGARTGAGFAAEVAQLLSELRTVPLGQATRVAGVPTVSPADWLREVRADYALVDGQFAPADRSRIEGWLSGPPPDEGEPPALCHNDLGDEHLIVDAEGRLAGVIDWTDAVVGDPARDLALLQFDLGLDSARDVMAQAGWAGDQELWERARWFAIRAGVWGICRRLRSDGVGVAEQLPRLRAMLGG